MDDSELDGGIQWFASVINSIHNSSSLDGSGELKSQRGRGDINN